jgi:CRISPR-associated protein Cas2
MGILKPQIVALSAYRLMWLMCLFDLPVLTKEQRKEANDFRDFLKGQGFEMAQFSVYMRFCTGKEHTEKYVSRIRDALPRGGKVDILTITDRQYETIVRFAGRARQATKNPAQFQLF